MDPKANLDEQLRLAQAILAHEDRGKEPPEGYAQRLAELVIALDGWVKAGGFLPDRWVQR